MSDIGRNARFSDFRDLPRLEGIGLKHAWFEPSEQVGLGTVSRITPQHVVRATSLVQQGEVISLCLPLTEPDPPLFGRGQYRHTIFQPDRNRCDDFLDRFYPQASTHWDGLLHVRCREYGFFGGKTDDPTPGSSRLGVEHIARNGIVGRGVLVDIAGYFASVAAPFDPFAGRPIGVDELESALAFQGTAIEPGDVLCIRFGWIEVFRQLSRRQRDNLASKYSKPEERTFAGLSADEDMAAFLWDSGVAAIACDNPAVEDSPGDISRGYLHRRLIPMLGFALGELFVFADLAEHCKEIERFDFLFVSVPLQIPGGIGTPANAIAIL